MEIGPHARQVAYEVGARALAEPVQRLFNLEKAVGILADDVKRLTARVDELERALNRKRQPAALANMETR